MIFVVSKHNNSCHVRLKSIKVTIRLIIKNSNLIIKRRELTILHISENTCTKERRKGRIRYDAFAKPRRL